MKNGIAVAILGGIVVLSGYLGQKLAAQPPVVLMGLAGLMVLCIVGAGRFR